MKNLRCLNVFQKMGEYMKYVCFRKVYINYNIITEYSYPNHIYSEVRLIFASNICAIKSDGYLILNNISADTCQKVLLEAAH